MQIKFFSNVWLLFIASCFAQDLRPSFPDVFQTEIEGTFVEENGVVEIDATMFYDQTNNRAALFITKEGELSKLIFNFDSDESISIDGNECEVQQIEDHGFFPFKTVDGKKKMSNAEEAFYFSKSKLDKQIVTDKSIPTLVYKASIDLPQYGKINCEVTHIFSKPDLELPTCKGGFYCNSTLMSISAICKNEKGEVDVDHVYRFFRFQSYIEDYSVFQTPPGVYCNINSTKPFPNLPSYFSFTFDTIVKTEGTQNDTAVFNTHKEIWYDAQQRTLRIDEFGRNGLLYSSRIFELRSGISFTIIASIPSCQIGPVSDDLKLHEITRLPKALFFSDDSSTEKAVYVGKRKVNGLEYDVWSLSWKDTQSEAKIVEDLYFLQIDSNTELSLNEEPYLQISHVNSYIYETNDVLGEYGLTLMEYFTINNFKSTPKEWGAFDVATCFRNKEKIEFIMKVKGPNIVKDSQSYKEVLQQLYNKIIFLSGVSIVRISELTGIFDGTQLLGIKGTIINNSESSGWPSNSTEPNMDTTFQVIKFAVTENLLSITFTGDDNKEHNISINSVKAVQVTTDDFPKPTIPNVFQTEMEGAFMDDNSLVAIHASLFFDQENNRAALFMTKEGEQRKIIYNFNSNESITISGNECTVQEIAEEQSFFPFIIENRKQMPTGDEAFFFTKSELEKQIFPDNTTPTLTYTANIKFSEYGNMMCKVIHIFSKPDIALPTCKEGWYCEATLMNMHVQCKDLNDVIVDNIYRFSRFKSEIEDQSVFLIPAGVHCNVKNTKEFPVFPSYFSFTFDTIEKPKDSRNDSAIFTTHKEVWYDAEFKIIRIDEFDFNGLLFSSRIFDLKAEVAFTIIASNPTCDIGPVTRDMKFDEITRLPKALFYQNISEINDTVYVGKRKVHGLDYHVWSLSWTIEESETKIVEEIYFVEVVSNKELSLEITEKEMYLQISHVDMYTYEQKGLLNKYDLTLLKYFSINNYRFKPKEWAAFDVITCFKNKEKKEFIMKVEGPTLVKGSNLYKEVLENLYNKIIAATEVSIVRISELKGIFDGVQLVEIRGLILDNSEASGWPQNSKEPNMEETFERIKKAASDNRLSIIVKGENDIEHKINVTSVETIQLSHTKADCFSGSSLAAASLVLLLIGVAFGVAGYYVFLKKKRMNNVLIRMSDIDPETESIT